MLAVFQNNIKQYLIKNGDNIIIDKINVRKGSLLVIKNLLMIFYENGNVFMGKPFIKKAFIIAKVKKIYMNSNNIVLKKKRRKNYKKKLFYKRIFIKLTIKSILN